MKTLLYLLCGHYLGDYGLQSDYIAMNKGNSWHVLVAHSAIQAGTVLLATGNPILCIVEFFAHAITDTLKCRNFITLNEDQAIHLTFRFVYAALIYWRLV